MNVDVKIVSNKEELLNAAKEQIEKALEAIGLQAEGYAKANMSFAGWQRAKE